MKRRMLEAHPSLLKKSGKMAIDIPDGAYVAVKSVHNTAQRLAPSGAPGHRIMKLQDVSITHNYICAVLPAEMKDICFA
jgi:predicted SAM-dependent methyltransferase